MSFSSKYPDILKSIAPSLVNYYKQFAEKEKIASVTVNHEISSTPSIDKFCTYLINHDGNGNGIYGAADKESISSATSLRTLSIIPQEIPTPEEKEQVQEPSRETTPPQSVKTATPVVETVADSTTTTSTPPTSPPTSGPSRGDVRRNPNRNLFSRGRYQEWDGTAWKIISRSRYSTGRVQGKLYPRINSNSISNSGSGGGRRRGGLFGRRNEQTGTAPSGRGRYPFEVRDDHVWKRNKWERL